MTRAVVKNTYGRLKGRFKIKSIAKSLDLNAEDVCLVIAACCVLHNVCEVMGEDSIKWRVAARCAASSPTKNKTGML